MKEHGGNSFTAASAVLGLLVERCDGPQRSGVAEECSNRCFVALHRGKTLLFVGLHTSHINDPNGLRLWQQVHISRCFADLIVGIYGTDSIAAESKTDSYFG